MAMSCNQVLQLSTASAGGHASEAERLELEAHLATCGRCSEEHTLLRPVAVGRGYRFTFGYTVDDLETVKEIGR